MLLFSSTIFLSAFLLFQIQPMIAKTILPWFGGSAAVWITAMLFFQTALLGGYLYAHWSISTLRPKTQTIVHTILLVLSLFFLPVAPALAWKPAGTEDPILRILGLLTFSIGLPYFLLSSTSPLIQAWYTRTHKAALPYRLFALSNLASLLGLLAYPLFVETRVTLQQQSLGWSIAFALYALLCIIAAVVSHKHTVTETCTEKETAKTDITDCRPPAVREKMLWLLLAGCASTLLLAVTNHLTQNVASIPFLWVLPLGLYLLTFILCFDFDRIYHRKVYTWLMVIALGGMAYGLSHWNSHTSLKIVIPTFSAGMFIGCMFFHGELVKRKPAPQFLTSFYLMLSLGGAFGGLLVGLLAPRLLKGYFELPLALIACTILMLMLLEYRWNSSRMSWKLLVTTRHPAAVPLTSGTAAAGSWRFTVAASWMVAIVVFWAAGTYLSSYKESSRIMVRNFYGGLRVQEYEKGRSNETRMLVHGTVDHGMQFTAPGRRSEHITYYGLRSGVGLAIDALPSSPLRVGIIGLGAGSLAAYAKPGDVFRFYEINPLVETLARTEFTYLADCRGETEIIMGDGRLSLDREPSQNYDLLVIDAFSGDAVPVHLLTRQALELYFRHLKPRGILALHVTNTHLDLVPVVAALSRELGKQAVKITNDKHEKRKIYRSTWALLSSQPILSYMVQDVGEKLTARPGFRIWTDDYSNLFQILK